MISSHPLSAIAAIITGTAGLDTTFYAFGGMVTKTGFGALHVAVA